MNIYDINTLLVQVRKSPKFMRAPLLNITLNGKILPVKSFAGDEISQLGDGKGIDEGLTLMKIKQRLTSFPESVIAIFIIDTIFILATAAYFISR